MAPANGIFIACVPKLAQTYTAVRSGKSSAARVSRCHSSTCARPSVEPLLHPLLLHPSDVIRQIENLLVGDRRDDVGHGGVVAVARVVLVAAQRLDQVILALVGDARHVVLTGESRGMAEITAVLLDQRTRARHA